MTDELNRIVPTLYVGLGGTGQEVVGRIKEEFSWRYSNLDNVPVFFLSLDTDSPKEEFSFSPDEFARIADFDGEAVLRSLDKFQNIEKWWPENLRPGDVGNLALGAGQVRPVGRLSFYYKYRDDIKEKLESQAQNLTVIRGPKYEKNLEKEGLTLDQNNITVYVIGSLCGGTGSGTFLDVGFAIRHLLKSKKELELNGIFTLAEGYVNAVTDGVQQERIQSNAYASMKEIDHFMDSENAHELEVQFSQNERPFHPEGPLFDNVALVDTVNRQGDELEDLQQLYDLISTRLVLEQYIAGEKRSVLRNVKIKRQQVEGMQRNYESFGVGAVVFHASEIRRYCLYRLIEDMLMELTKSQDARSDVSNFLQRNNLEEHGTDLVLNQLRPLYKTNFADLIYPEPMNEDNAVVEMNDIMDRVHEELKEVHWQIDNKTKEIYSNAKQALKNTINEKLSDETHSVAYVHAFLEHLEKYLDEVLIKEMREERNELEVDVLKGRMEETKKQVREAAEGMWIPFHKSQNIQTTFKRWYQNTRNWVEAKCESMARSSAEVIFSNLKQIVGKWKQKLSRIHRNLDEATMHAHNRRNQILKNVSNKLEHSFRLIDGVVDPSPVTRENGEKVSRFELIYEDYKPELLSRLKTVIDDSNNLLEFSDRKYSNPESVVEERILPMLEGQFEEITDIGVPEAVRKYNPDYDLEDSIRTIVQNCVPFVQVDAEELGGSRRPVENLFIGIHDTEDGELMDLISEDQLGVKRTPVSTGDKSRILILATETGYPAFILPMLKEYVFYYNKYCSKAAQDVPEFPHLDKQWLDGVINSLFENEEIDLSEIKQESSDES